MRGRSPARVVPGVAGLACVAVLACVTATRVEAEEAYAAGSSSAAADEYACRPPRVPVTTKGDCAAGSGACRWLLPPPEDVGRLYAIWRNTDREALWGRPGLVATVLGVARGYARLYPGEAVVVGDLDAPGPRHESHRDGVDVDLYLPGVMREENVGRGVYASNYEGRPVVEVQARRTRVEDLARLLAVCARGRLRILYNDPPVRRRFREWFEARRFVDVLGPPMVPHNRLHRFHFHVSVSSALPPAPGPFPRAAFSTRPETPERRASSATTSRQPTPR